ncbi:MAG: hypothetical protein MUC68_17620 [Burkholderiaceae bacterium]|nr:hypothetical protein [Burkholderiaceae bacterium]
MTPDTTSLPAPIGAVADPYESAWTVVLVRTPRGEDEIRRPLMPLNRAQQDLLVNLDGKRSLRLLVAQHPSLSSARLSRDAARLLAFGLVRQVQGELPRALVVDAMNLTMRLPAAAFAALAPVLPEPPAAEPRARAHPLWIAIAVAAVFGALVTTLTLSGWLPR